MGGYSAPDIYHLITGGPGLDPLFNGQDFNDTQAGLQAQVNQQVNDLNTAMNQCWQGNAAGQAVSGAAPLVSATDSANQSLMSASTTIGAQADAFSTVSTTVVPMAANPPQNNIGNQIVSFFGANTQLDQQISQYQTDSNTNIQAYTTYSQASQANAAAMPNDYGTLPNASPTITVTAQTTSAGSGSGFTGSAGATSGYGGVGGGSHSSRVVGSYSGTGQTSPSGANPSGPGSGGPGGTGNSSETLSDYPTGTGPGTTSPYDQSLYGTGPNRLGGGDETAKNNQYAGGGGVFGGFGGGAGEGGLGGGANGLGGAGAEGRGGVGANGLAPGQEETMNRAAAGAAGEPGMGGARGQGRKGEEDKEHRTAEYLQEADPDAIFGTDQLTVPPVIE
jgi:hypothetical protein